MSQPVERVRADLTIAPEPLRSPDAATLITALDADLAERYPGYGDDPILLPPEHVADGAGVFLVARLAGEPVGCVALRTVGPGTGEIKRMYVAPEARGARVGTRLLARLEDHARTLGLRRLILESGLNQPEALRMYRREGYTTIPSYGPYAEDELCVCLAKDLSQPPS